MNDSGRSVGEAQRFYKIPPADIFVFHDELDLAPAKLKVKTGGGNAGHNGLRSITAHIGNEYARVRIGIGHPGSKELVLAYVLHDFAKADGRGSSPLLDAIADAAPRLAAGDDARFLTDVARRQSRARRRRRPPRSGPRRRRARAAPIRPASASASGRARAPQALADRKPRSNCERTSHGLQMRHRRPAERRQVDPLQRADADGGGAGGQLSVLHHRAECRRGRPCPTRGSTSWPRIGKSAADHPDAARPSSTSPAWCAAPPRAKGLGNQFLANIREVDAIAYVLRCFEDDDVTHVEGRIDPLADAETVETELMLADLDSLEKRVAAAREEGQGRRQGSQGAARR